MKDADGHGRDATLHVEARQRFGRLVVIDPAARKKVPSVPAGLRAALCACDCGKSVVVTLTGLLRGKASSCGCAQRDVAAARFRSHDLHGHPLYNIHHGMMQRCYDPAHVAFQRYGGRGISVCHQWHDLRVFIEDIARAIGPRPGGTTLDRIDNDGNYEPGNVQWATKSEQSRNQRRPRAKLDAALALLAVNPAMTGADLIAQGVPRGVAYRAKKEQAAV